MFELVVQSRLDYFKQRYYTFDKTKASLPSNGVARKALIAPALIPDANE
jgi:hypothetical protein